MSDKVSLFVAADVIELKCPPGQSFTFEEVKKAVEEHKPALLFLCQVTSDLLGTFCSQIKSMSPFKRSSTTGCQKDGPWISEAASMTSLMVSMDAVASR